MNATAPAHAPAGGGLPYPPPAVGWYATVVLALLYWLSILDRFIISLLVEPIKRDLGITDTQFGLLHGFAFAITFAVFGLFAGALADRSRRRRIIFVCVAFWSLATAACGLAQSYWQLLLARVGVGAGEAGLNPSAMSMITDLFPRDRLTAAMAVYTLGATVGSGTAFLFGGLIVELVARTDLYVLPLLGEVRSWQAVFFIVGIPGALLSFIIFTLPEPARRNVGGSAPQDGLWRGLYRSYATLLAFMRERPRFFACHYAGFMLASIVIAGGGAWYPAHMGRAFGWEPARIGLSLGVAIMIAGVAGKLICGFAVDALYRRGWRDAQLRWYAACLLVATPIGFVATTSSNPWIFLGGIGLFLILIAPLPACYAASLNLVTPNDLRGAGIAFFSATAGLVGLGSGPLLIAAVAEHLLGGPEYIGHGMAWVLAVCCPLAALLLAAGCGAMRDAVRAQEQEQEQEEPA